MTRYSLIRTIFISAVLTSCGQTDNQKSGETMEMIVAPQTPTIQPILVDYKSDTYGISLRENYKIRDKVVDWRWAYLADEDDKIDSTGKDTFMSLDEPLVKYNNGEWLPSLHIETDKNFITSFTCSILFDLEDSSNATDKFLNLISKDIKKLKVDSIVNSIKTNGIYETSSNEFIETYKLTKAKELENDRFEYTIKLINGR